VYTDNSEVNIPEETARNADATAHIAHITERPFNFFSRQI